MPTTAKNNERVSQSLAAIHRWPSKEAEDWAKEFIVQTCSDANILAVVAFGSAVRSVTHSADIDLLVVYEVQPGRQSDVPIDVDIRAYSRAEVEQKIRQGHDLIGWIINYGQILCERNSYWTLFRDKWLNQFPWPSISAAEERAARSMELYHNLSESGDLHAANEQLLSSLTQSARALLLKNGIYPASRPELPQQLRNIEEHDLSSQIEHLLTNRQLDS